ncbi:hypothetical protein [Agriterribacter humi]|nr:hypothetical protein [Agriterribacter humi]
MPGIKQEGLALELGVPIAIGRNQKKISLLEQKEAIDPAATNFR